MRLACEHLMHALPGHAVYPRRTRRFGGVRIAPAVGEAEQIAGTAKRQNLAVSVFGATASPDDALFHEIEELRVLAFGVDRRAAALVFDQRSKALKPLLLIARQQILDLSGSFE